MKLRDRIRVAASVLFAPKNADSGTLTATDLLNLLRGGYGTFSGESVTDSSAMMVATVFACSRVLAGTISQLNVEQYRFTEDGGNSPVARNDLWWHLNESPWYDWTAASWKEFIAQMVMLRGDSYALIDRDRRITRGGAIRGFRPLHTDRVQSWRNERNELLYWVIDPDTDEIRTVYPDDILHFPGFGFDGTRSLSVVQHAARMNIGNAIAANRYAGTTFKEGALPQIALKYPKGLNSTQAQVAREAFAATYGQSSGNGRKFPLVLPDGADAKELSITPEDAQLLETRQFESQQICQAAGVPPILIGDSSKVSAWGTGIEQITLGFVRFTVKPILRRWEEELNRKINRRAPNFLRFDLTELLRGDAKSQADYFRAALGGPGSGDAWMSVDEVRRATNLKTLGGKSAEMFRVADAKPAPAPAPAPTPSEDDDEE